MVAIDVTAVKATVEPSMGSPNKNPTKVMTHVATTGECVRLFTLASSLCPGIALSRASAYKDRLPLVNMLTAQNKDATRGIASRPTVTILLQQGRAGVCIQKSVCCAHIQACHEKQPEMHLSIGN